MIPTTYALFVAEKYLIQQTVIMEVASCHCQSQGGRGFPLILFLRWKEAREESQRFDVFLMVFPAGRLCYYSFHKSMPVSLFAQFTFWFLMSCICMHFLFQYIHMDLRSMAFAG
jgi:hypothetical protein